MATTSEQPALDVQSYKRDGYVILRKFFHPFDLQLIWEEANDVFQRQASYLHCKDMFELFLTDFQRFVYCGKQVQHLINLHRLSLRDDVINLLHEAGLKWPVVCTRPVLYFNHEALAKERVYHTVDAHQDWRSMQGSSNACVLWVPLTDCPKELGALQVLPGSHLGGLLTKEVVAGFGMVDLKEGFIDVELNRGDALLFHSMLVHRSGENITTRPRWSAHFRYNDLDDEEFIKRGYVHPYIYKPVEELL